MHKEFKDFPDYIIKITEQIWEQKGIDKVRLYYAPDVIVRTPMGVSIGNQATVNATLETLAEFPNRVLLPEDVIWCGTPDKGQLSSHRILSQATHTGDGFFGTASGQSLTYRCVADCFVVQERVVDEWLIRDQGAIVRQIGWQPADFARHLIAREGGAEQCTHPFTPASNVQGPYQSTGNNNAWALDYSDTMQRIMRADCAVIAQKYDRGCQLAYPGGQNGHGHKDAETFWLTLRAAFPNAVFSIDHIIGREDSPVSPRVAVRWSLHGRHEGHSSLFGAPSNADVYIMGFAHSEFGLRGIVREYVLYDEVAIWKQILLAQKGQQ